MKNPAGLAGKISSQQVIERLQPIRDPTSRTALDAAKAGKPR